MKIEDRRSAYESLKVFTPFANENSFIEVTEWTNGEGWDINIDDRHFQISIDELEAIQYLIGCIKYGKKEEDKKDSAF